MEDRIEANSTNENIELYADGLADLPVADAQANETKGGPGHEGTIELMSWSIAAPPSSAPPAGTYYSFTIDPRP